MAHWPGPIRRAQVVVSTQVTPLPEDAELARLEARLRQLEDELAEQEEKLATIRRDHADFLSRYLGIVGVRLAKLDRLAAEIASALAQRGLTIVSGLALGIDRAAHEGALAAGGRTLAVLGSGIGRIHPQGHVALAARIAEAGALLSEGHPDAAPTPRRLAARNRIISGLSRWTIVIESGEAGGSMHTAAFAGKQGRVLAALPGSPGCDALLAAGALRLAWPALDYDALAARIRATEIAALPNARPAEQLRLLESRPGYH